MSMAVYTLNENKFTDTVSKINNFAFNAYNAYQYYKGNRNSIREYSDKASKDDLSKSMIPQKDLKYIEFVGKDPRNGYVKIKFNAREISNDLMKKISPGDENKKPGELYQYITDYENYIVTLELPIPSEERKNVEDRIDKIKKDTEPQKKNNTAKVIKKKVTRKKKESYQIDNNSDDYDGDWDYDDDEEDENVLFDGELNMNESLPTSTYDILSMIFSRYPDISEEDEDYLNSLSYDELVSEVRNRGWDLEESIITEDVITNPNISTELLEVLFEECDISYGRSTRGGMEAVDVWLPWDSYEEFNEDDYYDNYGILENEFYETKDYFLDLVYRAKYYKDSNVIYLQLHDHSTLVDIDNYDLPEEVYVELVNEASDAFTEKTDESVYFLGRSGRHCCVDFTLENLKDYNDLVELALEAEESVINQANEYGLEESVMVPTPTPYKSKNRQFKDEELELDIEEDDSTSDKFSYRVTYKDNDTADYEEKIVTAKDAEEAIKNFKEEMPGKFIAQVASDSFTDPQVYYQDGWEEVREESHLKEDFNGDWQDFESYSYYDVDSFKELATKTIEDDIDGETEYTLYECTMEDGNTLYVCIYGDIELYDPSNTDFDYSSNSIEAAQSWFSTYGEDDLDEELELKEVDSSYDKSTSKLEVDIMDAFIDYMMGSQGGFESEKDIEFYLNPHIDVTKEEDGRTKVQFRYEAPSYDSQIDVANELSKVVEKYDEDAYFDLYMYGVLEAWIDYPFVYEYSESLELKVDEDEVLTETPGLTLSTPEVNYTNGQDSEGISLSIEINGKTYKYVMKHEAGEEGKTPADIARTVKKMQKFSDGKALAYLKKNMVAVKDESLGESYNVHVDYGFQERVFEYPDKESAQKKVDQVNELRKQPYLRGLKVWMDEDNPLDESLEPSEETLEDCVQDYRENASGYEGIIDYVETQYPRHSQEFKDKVISYIKSKTESLTEDLSDNDTEVIKTINDVYKSRGEIESEDAINAIKVGLQDKNIEVDDDYLGDMIVKSVEMIDQLSESVNVGDRVSYVDDQEPRQTGIVQDIKDGVAKVSFLYKGNEEVVDAPVDKLQREWTQVSNIGQHKVDAMDMVEEDKTLEETVYVVGYDAGDNFSKTTKIKASSLGAAMKEFREKNPDKKITSIFEEGLEEGKKKSGNLFKDHHICQGCGNPLSKCTCKIEGLDD